MSVSSNNPVVNFEDVNGLTLQCLRVAVRDGSIADEARAELARTMLASVDAKMAGGMARDEAMVEARLEATK